MKYIKNILALIIAVTTVVSISAGFLTVNAATELTQKGSITINNTVAGKTYALYKMLELETNTNTNPKYYRYTTNNGWYSFFNDTDTQDYFTITNSVVTWKDENSKDNDGDAIKQIAKMAMNYAKNTSGLSADSTMKATGTTLTFSDLDFGYYLVVPLDSNSKIPDNAIPSVVSLDKTAPTVSVYEKDNRATVNKVIVGDYDSIVNTASITDTVNFKSTMEINQYFPENYVYHDTMGVGLTFNNDVTIYINGSATPLAADKYTLTVATAEATLEDNCTFEIAFNDGLLKKDDTVIIKYSAIVNSNAVIEGSGNPNTCYISYSSGGKSNESTTHTFVGEFNIFKYYDNNDTQTPLNNAEFLLYKEDTFNSLEEALAAGYTADDWNNSNNGTITSYAIFKKETCQVPKEGNPSYSVEKNKLIGWTTDKSKATSFTSGDANSKDSSDENGYSYIQGLNGGTYYITEISPPLYYTPLKSDIGVEFYTYISSESLNFVEYVQYWNKDDSGNMYFAQNKTIKILNQKGEIFQGVVLPATGGKGTVMFILFGSITVAVTGLLLITNRRMSKEDV